MSVDYLADNVVNTSHRGPDYGGLGLGTPSSVCNVDEMIFQTEHVASLTLDVEEQSVALAVRHHVGGHAGVEAGLVGVDGLEDEGLVTQDDAIGHILINSLSLGRLSR